MKRISIVFISFWLAACTAAPDGIKPIKLFDLPRYLGTWYEIARLDHSFERGLDQVSAEYSLHENGSVKVLNKGFNVDDQRWEDAEGLASFVGDENIAHLKVSFFGPFYGAYIVFDLDDDYQTAYVTSYNKSYLWFLSRTPKVDERAMNRFINTVEAKGFETEALIFVNQDNPPQ